MSTAPERFGSSFYRGLLPAAEQELYDAMLTRFEGGDYSGKLRLRTRGERGRLPGVQRSAR